jgi:hypothetical protein
MRYFGILSALVFTTSCSGPAFATARIHINLSSQTMSVESSTGSYKWAVSTARSGYWTPRGSFAPTGLQRMHYSRKYHMSPMPYSIFFRGGYAIHGTYSTSQLGRPASHGCVRLSPGHAAELYHMVQSEGGSISISGSPPRSTRFASIRHRQGSQFAGDGHRDDALAYASARHRRFDDSVRSWQSSLFAPLFGW